MKTALSLRLVFRKKKSILIDQSYNICPKHLATFLKETTALKAWLKEALFSQARLDDKASPPCSALGGRGKQEQGRILQNKKILTFCLNEQTPRDE